MKEITWTAHYPGAPTAIRYCRRCGAKAAFVSSGLFRVNAQQKVLDVWLVFKCPNCDATWNLTVMSRVSRRSLPPGLLRGFHENDRELAMRYATDAGLIKRNGAEPGIPEMEILGEQADLSEPVRIRVIAEWPSESRAAAAVRGKLGLSRSEFDKLYESGRLVCTSGQDLKKCRLSGAIVLEIR